MDFNDRLYGQHWTRYLGPHSWFSSDPEQPCMCEGHNCTGTHSTVGHTSAAATTAKSLRVPLFVMVPVTLTASEMDTDNWHREMFLNHCDVRIRKA